MKARVLERLAQRLGPIVREYVAAEIAKAAVPYEKRIASLEARPTLQYRDVWQESQKYIVGDFVTFDGSVWACKSDNIGIRPNAGAERGIWRLAVKRGADAR